MGVSLVPSRGVFVPTRLIFARELPPVIRDTLVQLMALAWSNASHELPPVSYTQLSGLMGKSVTTLHGHFAILRTYHAALRLRGAGNGLIIVTLADWLYTNKPSRLQKTDSRNLEAPVNDLESDHKDEEEGVSHPDLPLDQSDPLVEKNPQLPHDLENTLIEAGVFSFLLPEVARAGWQNDDLLALLTWCEADNPEKPGGLFMVRLRAGVVVPGKYYGERCEVCHRVGKHADDCRRRYLEFES